MLTLLRAVLGTAAATAYAGPETLRDFFAFYTYGPANPAVVRMTIGTRVRLWWAASKVRGFLHLGPQPEGPLSWRPAKQGDCVTYAFALREACAKLGLPDGALRLAFCTTGARANGGISDGHMVLTVETDRGVYACDVIFRQWRPWASFGYHDWNRETIKGT